MCGIFGLIDDHAAPGTVEAALAATAALAHRGPDDWGLVAIVPQEQAPAIRLGPDPRAHVVSSSGRQAVVLGHRRLSIIDLSEAGRQPMREPVSGAWIVFNGEIYNYRELRAELARAGVNCATATDTEVILKGYGHWGLRVLDKLRGMFAFGLWDPTREELILARDRVGKKPLFYQRSGGRLAFASELKAFRHLPGWRPQISPTAIHDYLTFGYVPGDQTIFGDVSKMPPGCVAVCRDGEIRLERYWDPVARFAEPDPSSRDDEACRDVAELLSEAVRLRLVGDVPLGAFLSGGLDSSAVVGLMARHLGSVKTFSIGFREDSFNELAHARVVASHFRTDHHEYVVEARAAQVLPDMVWSMDEPFADASALPTFMLARLARQHVTVVLTGDGGDESFAGYDSYRAERWLRAYHRVPAVFRQVLETSLKDRAESSSRTALFRRAKRFVEKGRLPFGRREWRMMFPEHVKAQIYRPDFAAAVGGRDSLELRAQAFHTWKDLDPITQLQLWDLTVYLPDDLLVKTDRATMAQGLEARSPLLDHVLIERCARLPASLKVRGGTTKYLLKKAVVDLLPGSVIHRAKQGFGVPVAHWLRTDLRELAHDVLLGQAGRDRGYFEPAAVRALIDAHQSGRVDHGHQLWALVTLELWHRRFIDGAGHAGAAPLAMAAGQ